jgi:hypothetical protein
MIDWLIIYCFTSRSRIFHLYGDVTITGEGLQNLGLCSELRAFEQGGIFIVSYRQLWHGTWVFPVSSTGRPLIQLPLTTCRGCGRYILTQIHDILHEWSLWQDPFHGNQLGLWPSFIKFQPHRVQGHMRGFCLVTFGVSISKRRKAWKTRSW